MKRLLLIFLICFQFNQAAQRNSAFEQLGDVLTLMPLFVGVVSLGIEDYRGFGELALGTLLTQGSIEILKRSFEYAHKKGYEVDFSKRPCCDDWKGMPSGHSGGGFSAASFVYYRYGWKPAIPVIVTAILTAASRVYAKKHTIWQVLAGGAIAWGFGWLTTTKYHKKNLLILPSVSVDTLGGMQYSAILSYRF